MLSSVQVLSLSQGYGFIVTSQWSKLGAALHTQSIVHRLACLLHIYLCFFLTVSELSLPTLLLNLPSQSKRKLHARFYYCSLRLSLCAV